ncbi:unnamed protein product [Cuscuta europaea]|uniref:Uncharacterized protein n=1 Tax=Cuscuta europaea TaxID=41803 RepID=A0A9P0ZQJ1_CUSEU|nr:unnamed protein product [Cuscuta europaea]
MEWSKPEAICRRHPDHKQPSGVCSCCLRERLSKISGAVSVSSGTSLSSSPAENCDYYSASSSSASGCGTPRGHRRITSDVAGRFSFLSIGSGGCEGRLKKSRSIAFAARKQGRGRGGGKKNEGFWSKLIKSTGKRTKKVFLH